MVIHVEPSTTLSEYDRYSVAHGPILLTTYKSVARIGSGLSQPPASREKKARKRATLLFCISATPSLPFLVVFILLSNIMASRFESLIVTKFLFVAILIGEYKCCKE